MPSHSDQRPVGFGVVVGRWVGRQNKNPISYFGGELMPHEKQAFNAIVLENSALSADMRRLTLYAAEAFNEGPPAPGTFVHVKVPGGDTFLRRPISIMSASEKDKTITLGIALKGEGTGRICAIEPGQSLNILGPLGKGFEVSGKNTVWLVGGGIGVAPLVYAAQCAKNARRVAFYGFRSQENAYAVQETLLSGANVVISTEDGSLGKKGFITAPLLEWLSRETPDVILACGPEQMLKAVRDISVERGIPCQLSLEQRMACGVGACLVCNCAIREGEEKVFRRVCKDGPVFGAAEVVFE